MYEHKKIHIMEKSELEKAKKELTPNNGFNLVGIDYFEDTKGNLYLIDHFDMYQDALNAKKDRKNSEEYFILYMGPGGEYLSR